MRVRELDRGATFHNEDGQGALAARTPRRRGLSIPDPRLRTQWAATEEEIDKRLVATLFCVTKCLATFSQHGSQLRNAVVRPAPTRQLTRLCRHGTTWFSARPQRTCGGLYEPSLCLPPIETSTQLPNPFVWALVSRDRRMRISRVYSFLAKIGLWLRHPLVASTCSSSFLMRETLATAATVCCEDVLRSDIQASCIREVLEDCGRSQLSCSRACCLMKEPGLCCGANS